MNKGTILLLSVLLLSCQSEKNWSFSHKIALPETARPLGMAMGEGDLWISDPENDKILRIDQGGDVLEEITEVYRPMHIDRSDDKLFIPNFYNDAISVYQNENIRPLPVDAVFDAPASVSVLDDLIAFADFYNHRTFLLRNGTIFQISQEGRTDGLLYYPTDVKLYKDKLVVADAYNNRIQVFDQQGNFIKVIGWQENIRVATGVDVFDDKIFVTDYYGGRVLVYDFEGVLLDIFEGQFNKPTDVLVTSDKFYVANYGENSVSVYTLD
ncbi:MAG: 6-bladed beta-propeller [Cyclobacteriaceae bacterium]